MEQSLLKYYFRLRISNHCVQTQVILNPSKNKPRLFVKTNYIKHLESIICPITLTLPFDLQRNLRRKIVLVTNYL